MGAECARNLADNLPKKRLPCLACYPFLDAAQQLECIQFRHGPALLSWIWATSRARRDYTGFQVLPRAKALAISSTDTILSVFFMLSNFRVA